MTWDQFIKKAKPLLKEDETIGNIEFDLEGDVYYPISQWTSEDEDGKMENANLWCRKVGDEQKERIYPIESSKLDKVVFRRRKN